MPTLVEYLAYWLAEVIKPNRQPNTYPRYELFSRRYIVPGLGSKRLDRLTVRDVQTWLNKPHRTACVPGWNRAAAPLAH